MSEILIGIASGVCTGLGLRWWFCFNFIFNTVLFIYLCIYIFIYYIGEHNSSLMLCISNNSIDKSTPFDYNKNR